MRCCWVAQNRTCTPDSCVACPWCPQENYLDFIDPACKPPPDVAGGNGSMGAQAQQDKEEEEEDLGAIADVASAACYLSDAGEDTSCALSQQAYAARAQPRLHC